MIDIRQPFIQGTDHEQLAQIRNYLYQLKEQLQFAFDNIEVKEEGSSSNQSGSSTNITINQSPGAETIIPTPQETFNSIKDLIIKSADIVNAYTEKIENGIRGEFVASGDYIKYKEEAFNNFFTNDKFTEQSNILKQTIIKEVNSQDDILRQNINQLNNQTDQAMQKAKDVEGEVGKVKDNLNSLSETFSSNDDAAWIISNKGYIKTGFLGATSYEGNEKYGIEIGNVVVDETNDVKIFSGTLVITPSRIEFYGENDIQNNPSAWLSGKTFYADTLQAVNKQRLGNFIDEVGENGDVTTRWIPTDKTEGNA